MKWALRPWASRRPPRRAAQFRNARRADRRRRHLILGRQFCGEILAPLGSKKVLEMLGDLRAHELLGLRRILNVLGTQRIALFRMGVQMHGPVEELAL